MKMKMQLNKTELDMLNERKRIFVVKPFQYKDRKLWHIAIIKEDNGEIFKFIPDDIHGYETVELAFHLADGFAYLSEDNPYISIRDV